MINTIFTIMEKLGDVLRKTREQLRISLRDVEEKTHISNAYLSQLENHKITQPSPSILRKLAQYYELSYSRLMDLAGHPTDIKNENRVYFRTSYGLEELSK